MLLGIYFVLVEIQVHALNNERLWHVHMYTVRVDCSEPHYNNTQQLHT